MNMMPNNGSWALDLLGRLFTWFDKLLIVARSIPYIFVRSSTTLITKAQAMRRNNYFSKVMNVQRLDLHRCAHLLSFKHTFSNGNLNEMHEKNAHPMPNSGSKR